MEKEQVLSQIAEMTNYVREKAAENTRSNEDRSAEMNATIQKLVGPLNELLEENKKANAPYKNAPISPENEKIIERGLFNGRVSAPYQRMLTTSSKHEFIRGTPEAEQLTRLQDLHDAAVFRYHGLMGKPGMDMYAAIDRLARHPDTRQWARELHRHGYITDVEAFLNPKSGMLMEAAMTRANEVLSPANTQQGMNNLLMTAVSAQLIDQVYVDLVIAANCTQIPLQRASVKFPRLTGLTQGVWGGIATTGSNAGSEIPAQGGSTQSPSTIYGGFMPQDDFFQKPKIAYIQFDVEHCLSFILFNDDMLEDSIIPWLPFIRNELSKNVSRAIDDAVYNGDASTNQDGHTDTFHIRNACHGLRWMCGATADGWIDTGTPYNATPRDCNVIVVNGTLALSNIDQAIRQMGKYALQPAKCVYAVRVPDYLRLMQLDVFRLYTNAGPQQTLHNGVMGQIYGIDVVPTDIIPLFNEYGCLTAGAGADGSGGDIWGSSMIWRRDQALVGFYDTIQIESTRWAPRLMTIMQADVRFDFQTIVGQTQDNTSGWPYVNLVKTTAA